MSATEVAVAATEQVPKEEKPINQNPEKVETTVDNNKQKLLVLPPPEMIMATSTLSNRNAEKPPIYNGGAGHSVTNYRFLDRNITESLDHLM